MSTNFGATESTSDAVTGDVAVSNEVKIGDDSLETKTGTLTMESTSAVQDSIGDVKVSGDEIGVVSEDVEKVGAQDSIDGARVSGEERGVVMDDVEKVLDESGAQDSVNGARVSGVEIGVLLENDEKVLDPIDNSRVSGDEPEVVIENAEKVLDESGAQDPTDDARVSGDETGVVIENAEKVLDESGAQDSIDGARVSGDETGVVMENVEKVLDKNVATNEEKEGEYKVTDLVWAKVRCYPWWPGQIFDPSASTDKAKKYSNKKGFLIAYFGDQSFAWNKAPDIKPFRKNFSKMEKQSNTNAFCNAVDCALSEVSRRIEYGLACKCVSEEKLSRIKTQIFVNAGIKKEASRIDGGDNFSTAATLKPADVVGSLQDLAREHFDGIDRLEMLSTKARLLAYLRWKGYNQFKTHDLFDESDNKIEDNSEVPLDGKDEMVEDSKPASVGEKVYSKKRKSNASENVSRKDEMVEDPKSASVGKKVYSKKRKSNASNGDTISSKKERYIPNDEDEIKKKKDSRKRTKVEGNGDSISSKKQKCLPNDEIEIKRKKDSRKRTKVEGNGVKEESQKGVSDKTPISSPKKQFRVGDSICRIAKQLSESPSILKKESKTPLEKNDEKSVDQIEEVNPGKDDEKIVDQNEEINPGKDDSAAVLILKFTDFDSIPSVANLNEIFSRYGGVRESETEVMKKNNCAKVVFEAHSDAETAFSSAGKFSIFGPSLISYRLTNISKCSSKKQKG